MLESMRLAQAQGLFPGSSERITWVIGIGVMDEDDVAFMHFDSQSACEAQYRYLKEAAMPEGTLIVRTHLVPKSCMN